MPSKYIRKFQVKLAEQEEPIIVASLTTFQTEEFLLEQEAALKETDTAVRKKRVEKANYNIVIMGLNNAGGGNGDAPWTLEGVKNSFDQEQIDEILTQIMKRSGLTRPNPPSPAPAS